MTTKSYKKMFDIRYQAARHHQKEQQQWRAATVSPATVPGVRVHSTLNADLVSSNSFLNFVLDSRIVDSDNCSSLSIISVFKFKLGTDQFLIFSGKENLLLCPFFFIIFIQQIFNI